MCNGIAFAAFIRYNDELKTSCCPESFTIFKSIMWYFLCVSIFVSHINLSERTTWAQRNHFFDIHKSLLLDNHNIKDMFIILKNLELVNNVKSKTKCNKLSLCRSWFIHNFKHEHFVGIFRLNNYKICLLFFSQEFMLVIRRHRVLC